MPLYDVVCPKCDYEKEVVLYNNSCLCPDCGIPMKKQFPSGIMVKMKGEGGYPSRHKQIFNTTYRKHPKLEHEKNLKSF